MIKNKLYIKLIAVYFIYSLSVLFSKIAGVQDNNISFIVFYFISLGFMGIYAILWQIILKKNDLSKAYPFKCLTIVFLMIFGYFMWNEVITFNIIIGTLLIFAGVMLLG